MSKEEIIAAIQESAKQLGHAPKYSELIQLFPEAKMGAIRKYLGSYTHALEESGLACLGSGFEVGIEELFRDWALIVRKTGKIPTMTEYEHQSRYSVRPLVGRFRQWRQVPRGLHQYAVQLKLDVEYADVLDVIQQHYKGEPEQKWIFERRVAALPDHAFPLGDRPLYGVPFSPVSMACGPTNEAGVIFLFGMLAERLGFVVTRMQTEFPDCEAWRKVGEERWQRVQIELEYESRNFLKHYHDAGACDLIVCWAHNWPECPLEVVELRGKVG